MREKRQSRAHHFNISSTMKIWYCIFVLFFVLNLDCNALDSSSLFPWLRNNGFSMNSLNEWESRNSKEVDLCRSDLHLLHAVIDLEPVVGTRCDALIKAYCELFVINDCYITQRFQSNNLAAAFYEHIDDPIVEFFYIDAIYRLILMGDFSHAEALWSDEKLSDIRTSTNMWSFVYGLMYPVSISSSLHEYEVQVDLIESDEGKLSYAEYMASRGRLQDSVELLLELSSRASPVAGEANYLLGTILYYDFDRYSEGIEFILSSDYMTNPDAILDLIFHFFRSGHVTKANDLFTEYCLLIERAVAACDPLFDACYYISQMYKWNYVLGHSIKVPKFTRDDCCERLTVLRMFFSTPSFSDSGKKIQLFTEMFPAYSKYISDIEEVLQLKNFQP